MELAQYKNRFIIKKQNPAVYLFSKLRKIGLKEGQIYYLLGRYEMPDLIGKVEEVLKIDFPNKCGLLLKMVKELKQKPRKKRQLKIRGL